jgi:hypothetical protein
MLKNQSAQNCSKKWIHCVDLVLMIPMQLEWAQTNIVCERYHVLSTFPNMQNVDCTQSVQADCADRTADVARGPYCDVSR